MQQDLPGCCNSWFAHNRLSLVPCLSSMLCLQVIVAYPHYCQPLAGLRHKLGGEGMGACACLGHCNCGRYGVTGGAFVMSQEQRELHIHTPSKVVMPAIESRMCRLGMCIVGDEATNLPSWLMQERSSAPHWHSRLTPLG
jgi:hypothetical protein